MERLLSYAWMHLVRELFYGYIKGLYLVRILKKSIFFKFYFRIVH